MAESSVSITVIPDDALPTIAELPGDLRRLAEIIAPRVADELTAVKLVFDLVAEFKSTYIYFRSLEEWSRQWRDSQMRAEYDAGGKMAVIARRWKVSERWGWEIVGRPDEGKQMRIWG